MFNERFGRVPKCWRQTNRPAVYASQRHTHKTQSPALKRTGIQQVPPRAASLLRRAGKSSHGQAPGEAKSGYILVSWARGQTRKRQVISDQSCKEKLEERASKTDQGHPTDILTQFYSVREDVFPVESSPKAPAAISGLFSSKDCPTAAARRCRQRYESTAGSLRKPCAGSTKRRLDVRGAVTRASGHKSRCPAS